MEVKISSIWKKKSLEIISNDIAKTLTEIDEAMLTKEMATSFVFSSHHQHKKHRMNENERMKFRVAYTKKAGCSKCHYHIIQNK